MLAKLKLLAMIISSMIDIMKQIEKAIPDQGKGKQKLAFVRETLENAADSVDEITDNWPFLEAVIASVVKLLNITGSWSKA